MKIRTLRAAFVDGVLKDQGAIFEWPNDRPVPRWAVVVEAAPTPSSLAPESIDAPQDALNREATAGGWSKPPTVEDDVEEPI